MSESVGVFVIFGVDSKFFSFEKLLLSLHEEHWTTNCFLVDPFQHFNQNFDQNCIKTFEVLKY